MDSSVGTEQPSSRGLATQEGLEGASREPNTRGPFCQMNGGLSQSALKTGHNRTIPPNRQLCGSRPGRVGLEIRPRAVEGEVAGLDHLDDPEALGPDRLLVGDPVEVRVGQTLLELVLVLPLPGE